MLHLARQSKQAGGCGRQIRGREAERTFPPRGAAVVLDCDTEADPDRLMEGKRSPATQQSGLSGEGPQSQDPESAKTMVCSHRLLFVLLQRPGSVQATRLSELGGVPDAQEWKQ